MTSASMKYKIKFTTTFKKDYKLAVKRGLNIDKLNYKKLLNIISVVSAFDISLVVTIVSLLNNFYLQLLVGFVLIMLLIIVSYDIVGRIYKKKGCCNNGKN